MDVGDEKKKKKGKKKLSADQYAST